MSKKYIVMVSRAWNFDAGDPVILEGVYKLIPELKKHFDIRFSSKVLLEEGIVALENLIKDAHYVIVPGTPSWCDHEHRLSWRFCVKHKKHMTLIGVGAAVPYNGNFYNGHEELVELSTSGLIDLAICRDRFCYWWLTSTCGFNTAIAKVFPCPAFYVFDPKEVVKKNNVVMSVAFPPEVSHSSENTFIDYFSKTNYIIHELEKRGHTVHLTYQRTLPNYRGLKEFFDDKFEGRLIHWFDTFEKFHDFHKDKDVYVGVRNHGALPCSGSGMPSLLLGTDYRQYLADEIPFLSRLDISHAIWQPYYILDWHASVYPRTISDALRHWRNITYQRIRTDLRSVINNQLGVLTVEQEQKEAVPKDAKKEVIDKAKERELADKVKEHLDKISEYVDQIKTDDTLHKIEQKNAYHSDYVDSETMQNQK